jgi:hypothetical protein
MMYPKNDAKYLWVSPSDEASGNGTFDNPFGRLTSALEKVQPGNVVVLLEGTYHGDVTINASGDVSMPLHIVGAPDSKVIVSEACWYFYDVCDLIVSNLTFRNSPLGAIAVMGASMRNRFANLQFENCGHAPSASSTLFFGGSGAWCNIVELCDFSGPAPINARKKDPSEMTVGLMISEGDTHEDKAITNHIIRRNKFSNYDYGILVGAQDTNLGQYGHCIAHNSIDKCTYEGIMVKCGDTEVKGNVVTKCPRHSISIATGVGSIVQDNRIVDCGEGVRIAGSGHSISNNCIVRSSAASILVMKKSAPQDIATQNIIIENNTFAGWAESRQNPSSPCIDIEQETSSVIQRNLFLGKGELYRFSGKDRLNKSHLIIDNVYATDETTANGVKATPVEFVAKDADNFANTSNYGASGWMCTPDPFDSNTDSVEEESSQTVFTTDSDDDFPDAPVLELDNEDTLDKSLFFVDRQHVESEHSEHSCDCDHSMPEDDF